MSNKFTTPVYSTLLTKKLFQLLEPIQAGSSPTSSDKTVMLEQLVADAHSALNQFYAGLSEPIFLPKMAVAGTSPDMGDFSNNLASILADELILFGELENIEDVILGQFNYMVSRFNRLNTWLKTITSNLGDYKLFATYPSTDAIFFADSFSNLDRVESKSSLLNNPECSVSQDEGIVTLPIDTSAASAVTITEVPVINTGSNGTPGNNQQAGAKSNSDISKILDGNADSWFEYERVVSTDDRIPLVLDCTINLGISKIINFIRINPNNFGTKTSIEITEISTSVDGKSFVSIKDDIPIAGFTLSDEQNIFTLASSTSKYAGQGLFTFTPRKAKYIRLALRQSTPYVISTTTGEQKFRYAIGIRDVHVEAIKYKSKGEVISRAYLSTDEISKVILLTNEIPSATSTSTLSSIKHYLSPDNGVTWHQIRPPVTGGTSAAVQTVPELLDFNGVVSTTIKTTTSVKSLRWKALLERNTSAFSSSSSELAQNTENVTELHSPPSTTPFSISLQKTPVTGSLKLVDTNYGARGMDYQPYNLALGNGNKLVVPLPFAPGVDIDKARYMTNYLGGGFGPEGFELSVTPQQTIFVGGEAWTDELGPSSTSTDKHYRLDHARKTIEFGDGTTGKAAPDGALITMRLSAERIFPSTSSPHVAKLQYPTVLDKGRITVRRRGPLTQKTVVLKQNRTSHQLDPDIISELYYGVAFSDSVVFTSAQEKNNIGSLASTGDWYLDRENGVLTSYSPTSSSTQTTVTYFYYPSYVLPSTTWDFVDSGGVANAIKIDDSEYITLDHSNQQIAPVSKYASLSEVAVVPGSISFATPSGVLLSGVYGREVPYQDGRVELLGVISTREEVADILSITTPTNVTRSFGLQISPDTSLEVRFSNANIFQTEVVGSPSSVGEYQVNRGAKTYTVRVNTNYSDAGYVQYYFVDPTAVLSGRYSVNYETGELYFHDPTGAGDTASYRYTDYLIEYPIARLISSADWTLDATNKKITLSDREIQFNLTLSQVASQGNSSPYKFYQASYRAVTSTRDDTAELEPYFTPILKDYALKVLTASRLV